MRMRLKSTLRIRIVRCVSRFDARVPYTLAKCPCRREVVFRADAVDGLPISLYAVRPSVLVRQAIAAPKRVRVAFKPASTAGLAETC